MSTDTSTDTRPGTGKPRLNRVVRIGLWLLLIGAVVCTLLVGAAVLWASPFDNATLLIDGERFTFRSPQGGEWLLAAGGLLLGALVLLLVLPLAVFMPLLFTVIAMVVALLSVLGVLALLASPLLLIGWAIWRAARGPRGDTGPRKPGATIGA